MSNRIIKSIHGPEPMRRGEYANAYMVGHHLYPATVVITEIRERDENLGSYGIHWFDVFAGETLLASVNALHVSDVLYGENPNLAGS